MGNQKRSILLYNLFNSYNIYNHNKHPHSILIHRSPKNPSNLKNLLKAIIKRYWGQSDNVWLAPIADNSIIGQIIENCFGVLFADNGELTAAVLFIFWCDDLKQFIIFILV